MDDYFSIPSKYFSDELSFYVMVDQEITADGDGFLTWYDEDNPSPTRSYFDDANARGIARYVSGGNLYTGPSGSIPYGVYLLSHNISSGVWGSFLNGAESVTKNVPIIGDESYALDAFRARHSNGYKYMAGKCYGCLSTGYSLKNSSKVNGYLANLAGITL